MKRNILLGIILVAAAYIIYDSCDRTHAGHMVTGGGGFIKSGGQTVAINSSNLNSVNNQFYAQIFPPSDDTLRFQMDYELEAPDEGLPGALEAYIFKDGGSKLPAIIQFAPVNSVGASTTILPAQNSYVLNNSHSISGLGTDWIIRVTAKHSLNNQSPGMYSLVFYLPFINAQGHTTTDCQDPPANDLNSFEYYNCRDSLSSHISDHIVILNVSIPIVDPEPNDDGDVG